ncbi:MAG: hypothetical protein M3177_06865 [Pseudomonadota bacterium]|nr:hypothetical protein [Pseudomonadota bacterium]
MVSASAALLALALGSAPAAAERVQARLTVQARVLPACTVSTQSGGPADATVVCTSAERPMLTVETESAPAPGPVAAAAESPSTGAVKVITLTY